MVRNHLMTFCLLRQDIQHQVAQVKQWVVNKMAVVHIYSEQDWGSAVKSTAIISTKIRVGYFANTIYLWKTGPGENEIKQSM